MVWTYHRPCTFRILWINYLLPYTFVKGWVGVEVKVPNTFVGFNFFSFSGFLCTVLTDQVLGNPGLLNRSDFTSSHILSTISSWSHGNEKGEEVQFEI